MSDLRYSKSHEWLDIATEDMAMGITEHAQELLGDMVFVELPEIGREVKRGDEIGVLESVKAASDLYAPVSGVVQDVNFAVVENPSLLNSDPYGEGWLVKIKAESSEQLQTEIQDLMQKNEYLGELTEEL